MTSHVDTIPVENRASLSSDAFDLIRNAVDSHGTLERALAWFFGQSPPLAPEDLIAQDEFSYDLLVPFAGGSYLSYDTG
jgi:hypothetical protein